MAERSADIIATARDMLHRADDILTGPTGVQIWHVIERLIERVEQAEAERDEARRMLLTIADACNGVGVVSDTEGAVVVIRAIDDALGLRPCGWDDTAAGLRLICGVTHAG